ncbi:hypothetical protein [Clostridium ganghwense]|uniref:DUF4251 domain-containing protein n=1 Tax=Clostridium ganghwense TaxID=312089 RepID=A0ABT4CNZ1_9CLOT|nr:hypothetical protein [Clostridium ganghwense]MCY6370777.1 hypothetical protein [Clostridium ganghwense]
MIKRAVVTLVIVLLSSTNIYAQGYRHIEIFSINQDKVVKVVQSTSEIQKLAVNYLEGIEGVYGKFDPVPSNGYAIKIPLESPVKIQGRWLNAFVDEVIIIFPEQEDPFLMIFENENRLVCFTFKGNTDALLNSLDFELNTTFELISN